MLVSSDRLSLPATKSDLETVDRLDRFLESVQGRALKIAQFGCGHHEDGFDILQDAMTNFVRCYRHKPEPQWHPLFFRGLQNRIKDYHRRRIVKQRWLVRQRPIADSHDPIEVAPDRTRQNPERARADDEFSVALERALGGLPMRQRQAFLLRTLEGMNVTETAHAMGCSAGSVKTHLSRAMSALRTRLGGHRR